MKNPVVMIFKIGNRINLPLYPPGSGIWISFFSLIGSRAVEKISYPKYFLLVFQMEVI